MKKRFSENRAGGKVAKKIGIMGGTFNPIHIGHLIVAEEALGSYGLDEVIFVTNQYPPHRVNERNVADAEDRFRIVELAISDNQRFKNSRIEIDRSSPSYTVDTLEELLKAYPEAEISFIAGIDSILGYQWYRMDELLGMLKRFIAATRPCVDELHVEDRITDWAYKR